MTPRFLFRPAAREEVQEARDWYELQRVGLGSEFAAAIDAAIDRIGTHPDGFGCSSWSNANTARSCTACYEPGGCPNSPPRWPLGTVVAGG